MTSGGEWGAESEVADNGRCNMLEPCCQGRGTGGPAEPRPCGAEAGPKVDHGEDILGISSEARVLFPASSCACSVLAIGFEGKRAAGFVGPKLLVDLFSNSDLKDDTGFCPKRS